MMIIYYNLTQFLSKNIEPREFFVVVVVVVLPYIIRSNYYYYYYYNDYKKNIS